MQRISLIFFRSLIQFPSAKSTILLHCFSVYCTETYDYAVNGLEIDDNAELVLFENNICVSHLIARRNEEIYRLETKDISHVESILHDIFAYCGEEEYKLSRSLRRLVEILDPKEFIRVSYSVIVSVKHIKSIHSALSQKFLITMKNDLPRGSIKSNIIWTYSVKLCLALSF